MRTRTIAAILMMAIICLLCAVGCADSDKAVSTPAATAAAETTTMTEETTTAGTTTTTAVTWLRTVKEKEETTTTSATTAASTTRQNETRRTTVAPGNTVIGSSNTEETTVLTSPTTMARTTSAPASSTSTATSTSTTVKETEPQIEEIIYGDVNQDRRVDVFDFTLMKSELLYPGTTHIFMPATDVTGDGRFDVEDVREVLDFLLGRRKLWSRDGGTVETTTTTATTTTTSTTSSTSTTTTTTTTATSTTSTTTSTSTSTSASTTTTNSTTSTSTTSATTTTKTETTTSETTTSTTTTSDTTTITSETTMPGSLTSHETTATTLTSTESTTSGASTTSDTTSSATTTTVVTTEVSVSGSSSGPATGGTIVITETTTTTKVPVTGTNIIAEPIDPTEHDVQIPEGSFATADGVAEIYDDPLAYFGEEWPRDGKSLDDLYAQYRQHTSGMYDLDELMARFGYTHDDVHTWGADCIGYVNPETLDQIYFYPNGWRIIKLGDFIYLDDNVFEKPYYVSVTNGHSEVGFMMDEVQFRRTFNLFTAYYELPYEFDYTAEGLKYEEEYLTIIGFDGDFEF